MIEICDKNKCYGCFACYNICPKNSIKMLLDKNGYIFPAIQQDVCINCGLCKDNCPANDSVKNNNKFRIKFYATYINDLQKRLQSSSGGLASLLAEKIIAENGIVYGCCSNFIDNEIRHIRIDNQNDLKLIKGSKYIHSYIKNTYSLCKNDLECNKKVLFIGTPCQIDGLKHYLLKEYDNLLTCDLICHGVPAQKFLFEDVNFEDLNGKSIQFRKKTSFQIDIYDNDKIIFENKKNKDNYLIAFMSGITFRNSCFTCKYADVNRVGDITLGDFWGINETKDFCGDKNNGVSLLIVNNIKGENFLKKCEADIYISQITKEQALLNNLCLSRPTPKHKHREKFLRLDSDRGFDYASKKCLKKEKIKNKLIPIISKYKFLTNIIKKIKVK